MKKVRMICDPTLLVAVILLIVIYTIATIWTMFVIVHEGTVANPSEIIPIRILFGTLLGGVLLAIVASSPRFLCTITLSETAITVWVPFRKKETFSYKQFRYIYCGGYFHGNIAGVGQNVWYMVIAQRHLSSNELNQINHVSNSGEVVKIRYTRKNYEKLRTILPPSHIHQLDIAIAKIVVK